MALVLTDFVPQPHVLPWQGPSETLREKTIYPRAEVRFALSDAAIAPTGAGDNQGLAIDCRTPRNFAYVLAEFYMKITALSGSVVNFEMPAITISDSNAGDNNYDLPIQPSIQMGKTLSNIAVQSYVLEKGKIPNTILIPPSNSSGVANLSLRAYNATANDIGYQLDFYGRFIQFDITQAFSAPINTPTLTR